MQPSYTHTQEKQKHKKEDISAYLQINRGLSALQQSYLHCLFYCSTKWLDNPMRSKRHVFIRQSLPPKVYNLAYETYIKKFPGDRKESQETDIWGGLCGLLAPFFVCVTGFLTEIPEEPQKLTAVAQREQVHLFVHVLQSRMDSGDIHIASSGIEI